MDDPTTTIIIELVSEFCRLLPTIDPKWTRAYCRFRSEGLRSRYVALPCAMEKDRGVFLLTVNANLDYNISFEWQDLAKRTIDKVDGGTGIPKGI